MNKDNQKIIIPILMGLGLILIGLIVPEILNQWRRNIMNILENSIWQEDKGVLLLAAAQVVAHNSILMFSYVAGAMVLTYTFTLHGYRKLLSYGFPLVLVFILHYVAFQQLGHVPPFAVLTLVLLFSAALIWRSNSKRLGLVPILLIQGLFILAINSLSVVPYFSAYEMARGDLTWAAILAGEFLKGQELLNSAGITISLILLVLAVIATELTALYQRRLEDAEELSKYELQYQRSQFQVQELRVMQEMHSLVHDLKTPLMTVQGLNSLLQISLEDKNLIEYTNRVEGAVDNLNKMISEILYDDVRKEVSVEELIKYVRAHVLVKEGGQKINFHLSEDLPSLEINLIRLARALINLIENAFTATSGLKDGRIEFIVKDDNDGHVIFIIRDNGVGIPEHLLKDIWSYGYSTKTASSGLGLGFVKRVVENHKGTIHIESQSNSGTVVRVIIPGVKKDD